MEEKRETSPSLKKKKEGKDGSPLPTGRESEGKSTKSDYPRTKHLHRGKGG